MESGSRFGLGLPSPELSITSDRLPSHSVNRGPFRSPPILIERAQRSRRGQRVSLHGSPAPLPRPQELQVMVVNVRGGQFRDTGERQLHRRNYGEPGLASERLDFRGADAGTLKFRSLLEEPAGRDSSFCPMPDWTSDMRESVLARWRAPTGTRIFPPSCCVV